MNIRLAKFFIPKNKGKMFGNILSPDNKYRLTLTEYSTKKGCWNYTQGLVYKTKEEQLLFEVRRNYSSFPYSWIDHPSGHQYLVCGADYQGQTVLELDTGERKDYIPPEAKKGYGFCWVEHHFDATTKILTVAGCVWACPYEFRFYDFSDPMSGLPEIVFDEDCIDEDKKWPTFEPNGIIKTYCTRSYDDDEDDEDVPTKPPVIRATKILQREGMKLRLLNEEVSEDEKKLRKEREEGRRQYEEKLKNFKNNDPLYLAHMNLVKDHALSPEDHISIGITHKDWCPHFKIEEQRICRRIVRSKKITIDLEWGMDSGPIKLVIYNKKGNHEEDKWFDHSVEGMSQAFKTAKEII